MKRHPALVALSHDHHHGLVRAKRLRERGVGEAAAFVAFFAEETAAHFREEEELLFPLALAHARELVGRLLVEHAELRLLVERLREAPSAEDAARTGELLEAHIRAEERELFPAVEAAVPDEVLHRTFPERRPPRGRSLRGLESEELNATLLEWEPGGGPAEQAGDRDVFVYVVEGSGTLLLEGAERRLKEGDTVILEKGRRRRIVAGREGIRYLTVHRRRGGLQIASAPPE